MNFNKLQKAAVFFQSRFRFGPAGYELDFRRSDVCEAVQETVMQISTPVRKPSIMLHGVMPRSGTNFLAALIELNPIVSGYPHNIWEMPFLHSAGELESFTSSFHGFYRKNIEIINNDDVIALLGASFLKYLNYGVSQDHHLLVKVPSVRGLQHFYKAFPAENLVLLMRDGRDVVDSYNNTFNVRQYGVKQTFSSICQRWKYSAKLMLACAAQYEASGQCFFARYEDLLAQPEETINLLFDRFSINRANYQYGKLDGIGVKGSSKMKSSGEVTWDLKSKPIGFNPTGRWSTWTNRDKDTFKSVAGATLIRCGYCDDLNW